MKTKSGLQKENMDLIMKLYRLKAKPTLEFIKVMNEAIPVLEKQLRNCKHLRSQALKKLDWKEVLEDKVDQTWYII